LIKYKSSTRQSVSAKCWPEKELMMKALETEHHAWLTQLPDGLFEKN
jgi:phosphopantetheinyl transferase (holo-ACP synthase)